MKESLTSFDIYAITAELQSLVNGWINKIYQPERDELLLVIRTTNGEKKNLAIKNGKWICITKYKKKNPEQPSSFAMTLRKYLSRKKIHSISQLGFDRIIQVSIGDCRLIMEIFSNGNVILVRDGRIILPLIERSWSGREIRKREKYIPPPKRTNPFNLDIKDFSKNLEKGKDVIRSLIVEMNLGSDYGEEICETAGIEKNLSMPDENDIKKLYHSFKKLLDRFRKKEFCPHIVYENGKKIDVLPLELGKYSDFDREKMRSFSEAVDEFFMKEESLKGEKKEKIFEKLKKLERRKKRQEIAIKNFHDLEMRKKMEGEIIYANYKKCQEILDAKEDGYSIIQLPAFNGSLKKVKLDFKKSVEVNAEEAYEEAKNARKKRMGAERALKETEEEIEKLKEEGLMEMKEKKKRKLPPIKHFWFEEYRWFISSDGNLVLAGKNASTNEKLVKKHMEKGDRYIHADIHGAASCIVKSTDAKGKKIPISEKTLKEGCRFAAFYSKAWNRFGSIQVYWVHPEQVSKSPQLGEFLPKGSFMIRGKRNYERCDMKVGMGEIEIDGTKKIMVGPPSAVKSLSNRWIIFEPGGMKKNDAAKNIAKIFGVSIQEIVSKLPGDISIIERKEI